MKRAPAHLAPEPSASAPRRSSAGASAVAVERLRFRERDGRPSAYTRLYAQGVDQMVHKDQVYQQFGLHKSPPALAKTKQPGGSPSAPPGRSHSRISCHAESALSRVRSAAATTRSLSVRGSAPGGANAARPSSQTLRKPDPTSRRIDAKHRAHDASNAKAAGKPQRRQSTIATQLLNKTLKIGPAVVHPASSAAILQTPSSSQQGHSNPPNARSPRYSGASFQQQLLKRPNFQHTAAPAIPPPAPRSLTKPKDGSPPRPTDAMPQPPVLVPVSRRTSSPILAPTGAEFGGMRRRPSVSPIRGGASAGIASSSMVSDGSAGSFVRRDSKMDRLVEQITVLKNSLGLSDEDLQWKVESTKGNAYEAADRHLNEAEARYDRLVFEIQLLSETPCDEASASLVKRLKGLVAQQLRVANELRPALTTCQTNLTRIKKELMDARIASELNTAKSGATQGKCDDDSLTIAHANVEGAQQRLLAAQQELKDELTKLNELLVLLSKETDALASACAKFRFSSCEASEVSTAFINILRCIPECRGENLVALCEQGVLTAQKFTGSKAKELKRKEGELSAAMRDIEVWKVRKEQSKEYSYETAKREQRWKDAQRDANEASLRLLRSLVPLDIQHLAVDALIERAREKGVLYTYDLALYIKQNKMLHWLVTHESDIARDNFLSVENAPYFLNFTNYDINELRALCHVLPETFEFDKDGKKADWRRQLMEHICMLVKQQQGDTIKAGWDPVKGARADIPLKPLNEKQLLGVMYRYPTEEEIQARVDRFELQLKRLAQKKEKRQKLEDEEIPLAKAEYLAVAEDARSEELQQCFGKATLIRLRDGAKQIYQSLCKARDVLKSEIDHSERHWSAQTPSYEQFLQEVAKIRALDEVTRKQRITGPFPQELELKPRERAAFKKLSVEDEAQARKQELTRAIADRDKGIAEAKDEAAAEAAQPSNEPPACESVVTSEAKPLAEAEPTASDGDTKEAAGAASFRRVKSLRVSVEVLRFLQNDFCSPRRTKSNTSLVPGGGEAVTGTWRRPSLPRPLSDNDEKDKASTATVAPVKPTAPTEPPKPKSKALLALLQKQAVSRSVNAGTVPEESSGSEGAMRPVMKMDFLGELKRKANKALKDAGDEDGAETAPAKASVPTGLNFLGELKARANKQAKDVSEPEPTPKVDFLDELKSRAKTREQKGKEPGAPSTFLDELRARTGPSD